MLENPEAASKLLRELREVPAKIAELEAHGLIVLDLHDKVVVALERHEAEKASLQSDIRQLLERVATLELRAGATIFPLDLCQGGGGGNGGATFFYGDPTMTVTRPTSAELAVELEPLAREVASAEASPPAPTAPDPPTPVEASPPASAPDATTSPTPATDTPHTEAAPPAPPTPQES